MRDRVMVTGASGYVGRHIVRCLTGRGYLVRVLVRRTPNPDFPAEVEVATGDLNDPASYRPALREASVVVHAGLSSGLRNEPSSTAALVEESAAAGVRRFVHLSSIAIYGNPPHGEITEDTQPIPAEDHYTRTKLAIELMLRDGCAKLPVTVLRLGCVYGAGGGWWTDGLLRQMRNGKLILVDGGAGIANLIHVSDAATLVALAIERTSKGMEVFNGTDGMPLAWREYFQHLNDIAGVTGTVSMSAEEALSHSREWLRPSFVRRVVRKLTGGPVIHPLDAQGIANYTSRAVYSNRKAATTLHFRPAFTVKTGLTAGAQSGENSELRFAKD